MVRGKPADTSGDVEWPAIERALIKDNAVDANASQRTITADSTRFGKMMDSLEATMMADPLAHEFGENYKELILDRIRAPEGHPGLNLNRIACSRQVCYAQMSGDEGAWDDFGRSLTGSEAGSFPTSTSSLYADGDASAGTADYRFMFTTNSQINSFHVQPNRASSGRR